MFIGHFGLAFAAKGAAPRTSLGTTFVAAQLADLLWPIFLLVGAEQVRILSARPNPLLTLDFVSYPWSHSLAAAVVWSVLFGLACVRRFGRQPALLMGALVLSHWLLDAIAHRPDLPLWPGGARRIGLGLWNSVPATLLVEGAMFAAGVWLYARAAPARDRTGALAFWGLVLFFLAAYLGDAFGPPPPNMTAVAVVGLIGAAIIVALAAWADRHRGAPA